MLKSLVSAIEGKKDNYMLKKNFLTLELLKIGGKGRFISK